MKLGVIGCGKMGTALVQGAIHSGLLNAGQIHGSEQNNFARESFTGKTGVNCSSSISEVLDTCEVILLCTKPQDIPLVLAEFGSCSLTSKLLISIAAGVKIHDIETQTAESIRVVRAMPNTPALIGKGAAAYALGSRCIEGDEEIVASLLNAVGIALPVTEAKMNAITGLSGSGPAFIYLVIEALADGGVMAGLSRNDALKLAAQTVSGAAEMVLQTGEHPASLKDMVTSPAGTTIAGLSVLEKNRTRSSFINAVMAATQRAEELGKLSH